MDGVVLKAYIGDETNVEIPDGVIVIDDNAFRDCVKVETVTFKDTITSIGDYAFYGCTALKEVNVPKLVTSLGDYCFANCTSLGFCRNKNKYGQHWKGRLLQLHKARKGDAFHRAY